LKSLGSMMGSMMAKKVRDSATCTVGLLLPGRANGGCCFFPRLKPSLKECVYTPGHTCHTSQVQYV
jgi:hypothetical protein